MKPYHCGDENWPTAGQFAVGLLVLLAGYPSIDEYFARKQKRADREQDPGLPGVTRKRSTWRFRLWYGRWLRFMDRDDEF